MCLYFWIVFDKTHTHIHTPAKYLAIKYPIEWTSNIEGTFGVPAMLINNKINKFIIDCLTLLWYQVVSGFWFAFGPMILNWLHVLTQLESGHFYRFWYITLKIGINQCPQIHPIEAHRPWTMNDQFPFHFFFLLSDSILDTRLSALINKIDCIKT